MIIIYNCYGGTHSSVLVSAVHLKKLPLDRIPTKEEILDTPDFNKLKYKDMGRLIFRGVDEDGNRVYTIGRGTSKALIPAMINTVNELKSQFNINETFVFINTSPTVPPAMTMGGFFSRGLGIHFIGVPLLARGARRNYSKIIELSNKTKELCRSVKSEKCILSLDNKGQLSKLH